MGQLDASDLIAKRNAWRIAQRLSDLVKSWCIPQAIQASPTDAVVPHREDFHESTGFRFESVSSSMAASFGRAAGAAIAPDTGALLVADDTGN
jgi:hypothetical protein